ncbi:lipopolysaccharide transport system ATP-binding protein [Nonlabens dokdonensis]|jgi:lipopolysaccharide transport system ATP-binding protein|uniref:Polysialic n=2 Tax=Nonlabens dokdonensis TaxID=328515 RepID=L7WB23_NONDD|nr:ABC transporter ATP-binding protein [Nonlabens dokdonensis]AGC77397.1 polysialic [Nonlabens dokdonensis DSW-6]PZX40923.1 lipopolysaccharide transport system ATP-binding protein [Nonlabens dokdonensis]
MENKEILVKVEGLSKKFCKSLKKSLKYGIYDLVANLRGKPSSDDLRPDEFWALKDINFELRRGECLGLIGHNGAGKSTLLKILNGLINPDHGKVTMRGRVGALIELGAGFNQVMTGRENIFNNGAILGFSREEIDAKVEEIIDFAEISDFIDMPVRNYSSGMKVRLGFAVAAQMEPDVLIIDEVLAVGDLGFVLKCFKQIDNILPNTAIIFVSHNMPMVSRICNQVILIDKGKSRFHGADVGRAIDIYYSRFSANKKQIIFTNDTVKLNDLQISNSEINSEGISTLNWGDDLILLLHLSILRNTPFPKFYIMISDKEQRPVAILRPNEDDFIIENNTDDVKLLVSHKNLQLSKGLYSINLTLLKSSSTEPILRVNNIISFQVIDEKEIWPPFLLNSQYETV